MRRRGGVSGKKSEVILVTGWGGGTLTIEELQILFLANLIAEVKKILSGFFKNLLYVIAHFLGIFFPTSGCDQNVCEAMKINYKRDWKERLHQPSLCMFFL